MLRSLSKSSLIFAPRLRFFARKSPTTSFGPKSSLKEKLESIKKPEEQETKKTPKDSGYDSESLKKFKKQFPKVDLEKRLKERAKLFTAADRLSSHNQDVVHLPKKALVQIRRVFAKYTATKVRELGVDYMKLYQALHAVEKPINLLEMKEKLLAQGKSIAFLPTQELLKSTPKLLYQVSKKKDKFKKIEGAPAEKKIENKEEKKEEKPPKGDEYKPNKHQIKLEYDQNYSVAYLSRKYPSDYASSVRVFTELSNRLPNFVPTNFLSIGATLGASGLGFHTVFEPQKEFSYYLVEPNPYLRRLSRYILEPYNAELTKIHFANSLIELPPRSPFQFSVVTLSRLLFEASSPMECKKLLETGWERVAKGGLFVIFQPGSPRGFRMIHDVREWFRGEKKEGTWTFVSPCSHNGVCPLSSKEGWWCNFEQKAERYHQEVLPGKKKKHFDFERFTYLVVMKTLEDETQVPMSDLAGESFNWSRVIRPAIKKSGHAIMDLCTPDGEFKRHIVSKSAGQKKGWRRSKKLKWGDQWNYSITKEEKPKRAWKVALNQRKKMKKMLKRSFEKVKQEFEDPPNNQKINAESQSL